MVEDRFHSKEEADICLGLTWASTPIGETGRYLCAGKLITGFSVKLCACEQRCEAYVGYCHTRYAGDVSQPVVKSPNGNADVFLDFMIRT